MFKINQKIVCISDSWPNPLPYPYTTTPKKGITYTIREIYESSSKPGEIGLLLNEISHIPHPELGRELGFNAKKFRPLESMPSKESEIFAEETIEWLVEEIEATYLVK